MSPPGNFTNSTDERQPLIRRRSYEEYEADIQESGPAVPVAGGTVLGIHNLAIVFPQFIVRSASHSIPYYILSFPPRLRLCQVLFFAW